MTDLHGGFCLHGVYLDYYCRDCDPYTRPRPLRPCNHVWLAIVPDVLFTPYPPSGAEVFRRPLQCYCKFCGVKRP
jgi:hypothetical protein